MSRLAPLTNLLGGFFFCNSVTFLDSAGELVLLRYFAGLSLAEAAEATGVSTATAYRHWAYARAWLSCELRDGP